MESIAAVLTAIGFWAVLSTFTLFVFGEDIAQSYTFGQTTKGHIQAAAIVGFPPAITGLVFIAALIL